MRNLTFSLILTVVTATFGLGWLFSQVYSYIGESTEMPPKLLAWQELAADLAFTLDHIEDRESFLNSWQQYSQLPLSVYKKSEFPVPPTLSKSFYNGDPLFLKTDGTVSVHFYMPRSSDILSLDVHHDKPLPSNTPINLILTLGFYIGMAIAIIIWLYPLLSHLNKLRAAANQFGEGDLSARVEIKPRSYILDIEREFNAMAERIQCLVSDNKLLSRAVSHDLKTPLARLRFGLDTLAEEQSDKLRQKYVNRLNNDLDEMESLVSTLLDYARLDEANIKLQMEDIDLNDFLPQLISLHANSLIDIQLKTATAQAIVYADRRYLAMQINNLIDNSLQYSKRTVKISVSVGNQYITLSIEDDGPGIPEDQWDRILQPFQKGGQKINPNNHGMGLAITSKISQWFRCKLVLGSSVTLSGAKIELTYSKTNP
ncbi:MULTISPECIES: ATP-binding protein [unclassified Microbulbifer]|uniref:ATP-binding protein n=1 Tax=unclassified Microbulbifer TaxID=2619833 RepID=UPI0027E50F71|nr:MULTISPECIES: ATP-binding protein [unclassified Microbulbifer]